MKYTPQRIAIKLTEMMILVGGLAGAFSLGKGYEPTFSAIYSIFLFGTLLLYVVLLRNENFSLSTFFISLVSSMSFGFVVMSVSYRWVVPTNMKELLFLSLPIAIGLLLTNIHILGLKKSKKRR
jgi:hypothetical protein